MEATGKIALCGLNARYVHSCLALHSLQAFMRGRLPAGVETILLEWTINDQALAIVQRLFLLDADIYAFSCYIWNISQIRNICRQLKQVRPQALILWGGPEVSFEAARWLEAEPAVDLIIRGEGEAALLSLCRTLYPEGLSGDSPGSSMPADLSSVPGLTWRNQAEGRIMENPAGPPLAPDEWPFPYSQEDLVRLKDRIVYYETSRGCPFRCSYCLSALDRTVRHRPLHQVFAELDQLLGAGLKQVKLVDRTFNCQPQRALKIWQHLLDRHSIAGETNFHFEIAGDLLDDDAIDLLQQVPPGFFQFEIGVQSIHPEVLRSINRPCNLEALARQVKRLRDGGNIHLHLDLIAGLPGETPEEFGASLDWVYALRPHQLQLGFLKILPGTPILLQACDLEFRWQPDAPYEILRSDAMTFNDLIRLKNISRVIELFYNSGLFERAMIYLASRWPKPSRFLSDLADWASRGQYLERNLGFEERSRLLWQFAAESRPELGTDPWLAICWRDLVRLDYISSGQKDLPAWLGFWECDEDPASKNRLQAAKLYFRQRFPDCRRLRVDRYAFNLAAFLENGQFQPGETLACFDLTGSRPALLDNRTSDDLY